MPTCLLVGGRAPHRDLAAGNTYYTVREVPVAIAMQLKRTLESATFLPIRLAYFQLQRLFRPDTAIFKCSSRYYIGVSEAMKKMSRRREGVYFRCNYSKNLALEFEND